MYPLLFFLLISSFLQLSSSLPLGLLSSLQHATRLPQNAIGDDQKPVQRCRSHRRPRPQSYFFHAAKLALTKVREAFLAEPHQITLLEKASRSAAELLHAIDDALQECRKRRDNSLDVSAAPGFSKGLANRLAF